MTELARLIVEGQVPEKSTVKIRKARARNELDFSVQSPKKKLRGDEDKAAAYNYGRMNIDHSASCY